MRTAAAVLVILGSILTVTIVWATTGLLLMGFGLLCGLIADLRDARYRPTQFANAKSSPIPAITRAPIVGHRDASPLWAFGSGVEGWSVSARGSLAEPPFARHDAVPDFESSAAFSEHAITSIIEPDAVYFADSKHGIHLANDEESLLPGMMSLVAQAVGHELGAAEPSELSRQVHDIDAVGRERPQTVDEPTYWSGEELTDSSGSGSMVVRSSHLILKELAEMSAAYTKNVEEVEQLTGLLDQMSKAKPAGS